MTAFILTPDTVWNPRALKTGSVPRKHLRRVAIRPRIGRTWRLTWRLILENEPLRFTVALTPFIAAMFVWRDLALPISQAPLIMVIVVGFFELRVLRIPQHKRERVTTEEAAARALDTLAYRGRTILSRLAAKMGWAQGELMLVVEQSELAFFRPLTLISVQTAEGGTRVLPLDEEDRTMIHEELFTEDFPERDLHLANLRENTFLRSITFDARGVSGHARLAAVLARPETEAAPA